MFAEKEPFPTIYVESQKEGEVGLKAFLNVLNFLNISFTVFYAVLICQLLFQPQL